MSATKLSPADCLAEARAICKQLRGTLWFTVDARYDPKLHTSRTVYRVYRRSLGFQVERASPEALVRYLRTQLPP